MATTTNYSWTTPDDTALVKDGAAAIRSLGTAIDTTVFNNASAAVAKATVDAKGDLIAGTADNTIARLAVGANDTVLTADSNEATGLKWATPSSGGMTVIASGSLTGALVSLTSIPGIYKDLRLILRDFYPNADDDLALEINDTLNIYGNSTNMTQTTGLTSTYLYPAAPVDNRDADNYCDIIFLDYTNAVKKNYVAKSVVGEQGSASFIFRWTQGAMNLTGAITKIELLFNGASTFSGGTYILYGVK